MQYSLPFTQSDLHTPGHVNCDACRVLKERALMRITKEMAFEDAAKAFYELRSMESQPTRRAAYVRKNTLRGYQRHTASLALYFAGMKLEDIHWWNMRGYQEARDAGSEPFLRYRRPQDAKPRKVKGGLELPPVGKTPCRALPQQINQELDFLKRLKRLALCWTD